MAEVEFEKIRKLGRHDIGRVFRNNRDTGELALYCYSHSSATNSVAVNIKEFRDAVDMKISWLLLKLNNTWKEVVPIQEAIERVEQAPQQNGTDYKLVSPLDQPLGSRPRIPF